MMTRTFDYFFTGTATIRRPAPIIAGGKRSTAPATEFTILCTPLSSVTDDEARREVHRPAVRSPLEIQQVFAGSTGLQTFRKGDELIIGSDIYPIRHAEFWNFPQGERLTRIIVEILDR
jgi:hypothetical protein